MAIKQLPLQLLFVEFTDREVSLNKIQLIAEVGVNHNGDISLAKEMIHAAAENGADYVKFQSWQSSKFKTELSKSGSFFGFKNQQDFFDSVQLTDDQHYHLMEACEKHNVKFLTTCFDRERVEFLSSLGSGAIKVASCDATSETMIKELSAAFKDLIVSTGMSSRLEIEKLIKQLEDYGKDYYVLHCISMYPTPLEKINLERFKMIKNSLGPHGMMGISDHSLGTTFPKVAVVLGAKIIEKHFTLDRKLPGPDNPMSINPEELKSIRGFCDDFYLLGKDSVNDVYDEEKDLRNAILDRFGNNR